MRFIILNLILVSCFLAAASAEVRFGNVLTPSSNRKAVVKKMTTTKSFAEDRIGYVLYDVYFPRPEGMTCVAFENLVVDELFLGSDNFYLSFFAEVDNCYDATKGVYATMFVNDSSDTAKVEMKRYLEQNQGRVITGGEKLHFWKETNYLFPSKFVLTQRGRVCDACVEHIVGATLWTQSPHFSAKNELFTKGSNAVKLPEPTQFLAYIENIFDSEKRIEFEKSLKQADSIEFTMQPHILLENGKVLQNPFGEYAERRCVPRGVCY